jgi:hypothetical protein
MVSTVSLLPLASAVVASALAVLALLSTNHRSLQQWLFLGLNAAVATWCLGYFLEINFDAASVGGADTTAFAGIGTPGWLIHVLASLGMAAAPVLWFLFAAERTGRTRWLSGWRLAAACAPGAYTLIELATNPIHGMSVLAVSGSGIATLGPPAIVDQLLAFVLIAAGAWMIGKAAWHDGRRAVRLSAMRILVAAALPVTGGGYFFVRSVIGHPLAVNPAPELFVIMEVILAYEMLFAGLTDIGPYPGNVDADLSTDAAITVDEQLVVLRFTPAAGKAFPGLAVGESLSDALPEIARHTQVCMFYGLDQLAFEVAIGARKWWGRVQRRATSDPIALTCVVQLTEVLGAVPPRAAVAPEQP